MKILRHERNTTCFIEFEVSREIISIIIIIFFYNKIISSSSSSFPYFFFFPYRLVLGVSLEVFP